MIAFTQRQTGDTTRNILSTCTKLSTGNKILVICLNHHSAAYFKDKILGTIRFLQSNMNNVSFTSDSVNYFNGSAKIVSIAMIDNLRGQKYDTLIVDGGTLEYKEILVLKTIFPYLSSTTTSGTVKKKKKKRLELVSG